MKQYFRYIYDYVFKKNSLHQHVCTYVHWKDETQNTSSDFL